MTPDLTDRERPGGAWFERAYWRLLDGGIADSPRDLWDADDSEQERAYLKRFGPRAESASCVQEVSRQSAGALRCTELTGDTFKAR